MNQEQLALHAQIEKLQAQNDLMRKITTRNGFCQYYFEILPKFNTNEVAFNHVNELYYELFKEYRYSDYLSFKQVIRWFHNKK